MSELSSRAVMERRAAADVEGDDALRKMYRQLDFFPTPPWAARAGAELIKRLDPYAAIVWEPACGEGHMAHGLADYFETVHASDIHPYTSGKNGAPCEVRDFLEPYPQSVHCCDWIVTNPPFAHAARFVQRGLQIAKFGVAVLVRLAWLESEARYPLLYSGAYPLSMLAPFSERVAMQLGSWDPELSTATAYAWFLFMKERCGGGRAPPQWSARLHPIPPGTRARLTRKDDAPRFGMKRESPLFDAERQAPLGAASEQIIPRCET